MKRDNDEKFEKQVNHLQSFIGMPMWNGRNPSLNEIREFDRRIIEQQTKDMKPKRRGLLKRIFSWIQQYVNQSSRKNHSGKAVTVINKRNKKNKKELNNIDSECCMQANT